MVSKKVGWGIIGCGVIGPTHAVAINEVEDAALVATCDVIPERAEAMAKQYNADHWYTDYNEMLKRDDIDVVSICVPSGLHGEVAEAAAKAGKHVFTEKPMEITKAKIDRMIQVCREEGVKLGCVFQMRTVAANIIARQTIQEGRLGTMVLADCYQKYYRSPEYYKSADWRATWELDGGGALMNQCVHGIDLLLWMVGSPVESVVAQAEHLVRDIVVEDTAVALLKFKNGAMGVIEGTTSCNPGQKARFDIHGNDGTIILENGQIVQWHVPDMPKPEIKSPKEAGEVYKDPKALSKHGHIVLVKDMTEAILHDRQPMITGEEARKAVDLILAIYESAQNNRRVYLNN